jgi:hypothetical protein
MYVDSQRCKWTFDVLPHNLTMVFSLTRMQRNKAVGSVFVAFDLKLLKLPSFWLLVGWGFFSILGYIVLLFSLPSYARSVGLTAQQGSVIGAILNLGQGKVLLIQVFSPARTDKDSSRPAAGWLLQ